MRGNLPSAPGARQGSSAFASSRWPRHHVKRAARSPSSRTACASTPVAVSIHHISARGADAATQVATCFDRGGLGLRPGAFFGDAARARGVATRRDAVVGPGHGAVRLRYVPGLRVLDTSSRNRRTRRDRNIRDRYRRRWRVLGAEYDHPSTDERRDQGRRGHDADRRVAHRGSGQPSRSRPSPGRRCFGRAGRQRGGAGVA